MRHLMPHQQAALQFLEQHNGQAALFLDCGTGKTLVAIHYVMQHNLLPALVICRRDDYYTWQQELALEQVSARNLQLITSGTQELQPNYPWTLVTYDLVRNKRIYTYIRSCPPYKIVIADESHSIKRWRAQRTKAVIGATRHIPRRVAMTGTPITNDPGDVFTQCLFVDDGKTFGSNYWSFRNTYYVQSGPGWYLRHSAKQHIIQKLSNVAFHVDADDVLTLPPVRHFIKAVPMSGQQRRHYSKILKEWEVQLPNAEVIELNQVIAQLTKLRQVSSGFMYDKQHKSIWLKSPKLKLLKELLTSEDYFANKSKVVIWCSHTAEIYHIYELVTDELGKQAVVFTGSQSSKARSQARKRFYKDKNISYFIGQSDSGVGMNELAVADTAIYFSNSFKVVSRQQSEARIRRRGSEKHKVITYVDLVCEKSIDEHILKSLQSHRDIADYILSKIRERVTVSQILR